MKTKLNLTIESDLVPRSKIFAKRRGKSVSELVEELLKKVISDENKSFTSKWIGRLTISQNEDVRTKYLKDRYK